MGAANMVDLPDYLKIPARTIPSFHSRIGEHAVSSASRPANSCGYPVPGSQTPSATSVMAQDYFVRYDIPSIYFLVTNLTEPRIVAISPGQIYWTMASLTISSLAPAVQLLPSLMRL